MNKFEIRTATANDYREIYGINPPFSLRAWSVFIDGKLSGIAGATFTSHLMIAFSRKADGAKASKRLIWEISQALMEKIKGIGAKEIVAIADSDYPCSGAFLERLGFRWVDSGPSGEIYKCTV